MIGIGLEIVGYGVFAGSLMDERFAVSLLAEVM